MSKNHNDMSSMSSNGMTWALQNLQPHLSIRINGGNVAMGNGGHYKPFRYPSYRVVSPWHDNSSEPDRLVYEGNKGIPDLLIMTPTVGNVFVEIKKGKDRLSKHQKNMIKVLTDNGQRVVVINHPITCCNLISYLRQYNLGTGREKTLKHFLRQRHPINIEIWNKMGKIKY